MGDSKYVLAMYDVRGKQQFIFKTNKLQEIVGASWIIRDIYKDYLFPVAESLTETGKGIYNPEKGEDFSAEKLKWHLDKEGYLGEVVYEGGGNFILIFKSMTAFNRVTYAFTKKVMQEIGTLQVLGTAVEIESDLADYKSDQKRLYAEHRIREAEESSIAPWSCLPIVQVDRKTSRALVDYSEMIKNEDDKVKKAIRFRGKLSKESLARLLKYHKELDKPGSLSGKGISDDESEFYRQNEQILDKIVEEKGKDSKLAVVYIDGNSMGAKVQERTKGITSYDECVNELRKFSDEIQKTYVEDGIKAALSGIKKENRFRIVVYAGDEINFIVMAKDAFQCAKKYLEYLREKQEASSCAGICVFNSHAPYSDAYRIAEEACESGKQMMKEKQLSCAAFIDYHISQGAMGSSLEAIRDRDNEDGVVSRPWLMWCKDEIQDVPDVTRFEDVERIIKFLNVAGRSNAKGLAFAAKAGSFELTMEINRIYGHLGEKEQVDNKELWESVKEMQKPYLRKIVYDAVIAFDLWFDENNSDYSGEGTDDGKN